HVGPHAFGHRDRSRRVGHAAGAGLPGRGPDERTSPATAPPPQCAPGSCHRNRPIPVLWHGAEPSVAVAVEDARQLLLDFAEAPGYLRTVQAAMFDVPTRLERITCPVLFLQGTADPLVSMQSPRFLAFVRHAQLQWLPGLSHVPISDYPRLVASLMLRFLKTATREKEHGDRLDRRAAAGRGGADGVFGSGRRG